jgi:hypothetical protein
VFENALSRKTGGQEAYTMAVHQLEQGTAGPIDTGDSLQVD